MFLRGARYKRVRFNFGAYNVLFSFLKVRKIDYFIFFFLFRQVVHESPVPVPKKMYTVHQLSLIHILNGSCNCTSNERARAHTLT